MHVPVLGAHGTEVLTHMHFLWVLASLFLAHKYAYEHAIYIALVSMLTDSALCAQLSHPHILG